MEKLGFDLDDGSSPTDVMVANPQASRRLSIQKCIQSLVHACQCTDDSCGLAACQKMKRAVEHNRSCKRTCGACPVCRQLIELCYYHVKLCTETKCTIPFCVNMKLKMKQQNIQARHLLVKMLRRGMASMRTANQPMRTSVPAITSGSQNSSPATLGLMENSMPSNSIVNFQQGLVSQNTAAGGERFTTSTVQQLPGQLPNQLSNQELDQDLELQQIIHNITSLNLDIHGKFVPPMDRMPSFLPPGSIPHASPTEDWRQSVSQDLRKSSVQNLVQTIYPTSDFSVMPNARLMYNLVTYAWKVEREIYKMANSRSEYDHLLAEQAYIILTEVEQKNIKRRELQQQQQQPGIGHLSSC